MFCDTPAYNGDCRRMVNVIVAAPRKGNIRQTESLKRGTGRHACADNRQDYICALR
jgi:hypothetical protein